MPDRKPPRIVVAGAGIAGSLIASGLGGREDVEVICLEKSGRTIISTREPDSTSDRTPSRR